MVIGELGQSSNAKFEYCWEGYSICCLPLLGHSEQNTKPEDLPRAPSQ